MNRVTAAVGTGNSVSTAAGFDIDGDGKREFVLRRLTGWNSLIYFYESTGDNALTRVHTLDVDQDPPFDTSTYPSNVGDADGDGLMELTVVGRTTTSWFTRVYESVSPNGYPTTLVWEIDDGSGWEADALIADTDDDGRREIVLGGQANPVNRVAIYENDGDNSYSLTYSQSFPLDPLQSITIANDLDGDGRVEIVFGGVVLHPSVGRVYMVESSIAGGYEQVWTHDLVNDGHTVNPEAIAGLLTYRQSFLQRRSLEMEA